MNYEDYLKTPAWRLQRIRAIKRARGRCQACNSSKSLHVHHRTYERLGHEDPEDLTVFCDNCHKLFHNIKRHTPSKAEAAIETLNRLAMTRSPPRETE